MEDPPIFDLRLRRTKNPPHLRGNRSYYIVDSWTECGARLVSPSPKVNKTFDLVPLDCPNVNEIGYLPGHLGILGLGPTQGSTASLHTKILDFRGFDSSIILISRGGILMSIGSVMESRHQQILVGIILAARLGVAHVSVPAYTCQS